MEAPSPQLQSEFKCRCAKSLEQRLEFDAMKAGAGRGGSHRQINDAVGGLKDHGLKGGVGLGGAGEQFFNRSFRELAKLAPRGVVKKIKSTAASRSVQILAALVVCAHEAGGIGRAAHGHFFRRDFNERPLAGCIHEHQVVGGLPRCFFEQRNGFIDRFAIFQQRPIEQHERHGLREAKGARHFHAGDRQAVLVDARENPHESRRGDGGKCVSILRMKHEHDRVLLKDAKSFVIEIAGKSRDAVGGSSSGERNRGTRAVGVEVGKALAEERFGGLQAAIGRERMNFLTMFRAEKWLEAGGHHQRLLVTGAARVLIQMKFALEVIMIQRLDILSELQRMGFANGDRVATELDNRYG